MTAFHLEAMLRTHDNNLLGECLMEVREKLMSEDGTIHFLSQI